MAETFDDFMKAQSQPQAGSSFDEFMAGDTAKPALPVGAEKTGLPGVPLKLPQVEEQGLGSVAKGVIRDAGQTFDDYMRTTSASAYEGIRGAGGGLVAVDRAIQQLNPLVKPGQLSAVGAVGQSMIALAEDAKRLNPPTPHIKNMEQREADLLNHPELLKEPQFWARLGGNVTGSMLTMLPAGMGAASRAEQFAHLAGKYAPAVQAAAGPGAAAFVETFFDAGNTYQDAIDAGHSPEKAGEAAAQVFAREFPTTLAFDAAGLFNENVKGKLRKALVSAAAESGQEAAQGVAQRTAERDVLGEQKDIWGPVPLELLSGLMGGPVGSVMLGGGGGVREASAPQVDVQGGVVEASAPPMAPLQQPATVKESLPVQEEAKPAPVETPAPGSFAEFMQRDAQSQRAIADADVKLAVIEPEAYEAGKTSASGVNPFDGLAEPDARIRAAAFEAGRKAAATEVQADAGAMQADRRAAGDVDRGVDQVPVLPAAAGDRVSGPESSGPSGDVNRVPDVRTGNGDQASSPGPVEALSKPVEKQEVTRTERPKTREFARAVEQHGRWETIFRKAIADGNTKLETAAARMVDKYGAAIRAEVPDHLPVMADEIRDEVEINNRDAAEKAKLDEFRKQDEARRAAAAPAKPAPRKRPGRTAAPGVAESARAPEQTPQPAAPVAEAGLTKKAEPALPKAPTPPERDSSGRVKNPQAVYDMERYGREWAERDAEAGGLKPFREAVKGRIGTAWRGMKSQAEQHFWAGYQSAKKAAVAKESAAPAAEAKPAAKSFDDVALDQRRMVSEVSMRAKTKAKMVAAQARVDTWVMEALRKLNPDGNNVTTAKLREALPGVSKEALDASVGRLYRAEAILVDRHSGPMMLKDQEREQLVYDDKTRAHYVAARLNPDSPAERALRQNDALDEIATGKASKRGERGAVSLDLLTAGRAETLIKVMETGKARAADAYAYLVKPLADRIADEGNGAGKDLVKLLRTARDRGEVAAGQLLAALDDVKLSKLSKAERFELTDALEGRKAPETPKVKEAFARVRELTDAVARVAVDLKVQVKGGPGKPRQDFVPRANYLPHVIRPTAALKSGRVREDIVANLVHLEIAPNEKAAAQMLDEYIQYVDSGKQLDKVLDYLVSSGQAPDRATALARMERFKSQVKREGSLEYSREVNLPFYDPDPARVMAPHLASQAIRLTQIAMFGQDDQRINAEIMRIREAGGNSKMVREAVDKILGRAMEADDAAARVSRLLRAIQTAKLGLAVIPNSVQGTMNSLVAADVPSVLLGWKGLLSKEGRRFAVESGAAIEPVLSEAHREFGGSELMTKYLNATGFSATERWNRILAANAGKAYVGRMFEAAKQGDKRGNRLLREFIGEEAAAAAIERGELRDRDLLLGAKRFSDLTQFRTRPEDLPGFASTNMGKVFFQFKSFAYNQSRLMHRETVTAVKNGEVTRGLRALLLLAVLFPLQGELVRRLREMIRGGDPKDYDSKLAHYWDAMAASSVLGFVGDTLQATGTKRGLEFLAGPTLSTGGDTMNLAGTLADSNASDEAKNKAIVKYLRRHLPLGQVWGRALED